jgi:hypothetical protein
MDMFDIDLPNKDPKKKKNKVFMDLIAAEIKAEYNNEYQDIEAPDVIDGIGAIAWKLCNNKYNKMPSSIYVERNYSIKLLDYLKSKGKVVYRKIYEAEKYSELLYVILYNDCYYTISVTEMHGDDLLVISGIGAYHTLDVVPNYDEFDQFLETPKHLPKIGIIKTTRFGPAVSWLEHSTDMKFDYDNYNQDFKGFFDDMKQKITGESKTGLYLLYGEAGTGKSSAIRHLIGQIDRPVVYIPPQMINSLSSPEFTELVTCALKGSILVIEDAEKALMKRESEDGFFNSELVSSVLNLTDGLYADLAQTSIIATYNCDRNMVDAALLRKGRLRSEYHFRKLTVDRSQKLMDNLGHEVNIEEPMSLADIFNYEKQYTNKTVEKKRAVGFGG